MQLTPHFSLEEFGGVPKGKLPAVQLVAERLEVVRAAIGKPIVITSGYRSPAHNKAIGGAPNSAHIRGLAADYQVSGFTSLGLAEATREALRAAGEPWDQIIWYASDRHCHLGLDLRMRGQMFRGA